VFLEDGITGAGTLVKPDIALCSQDSVLFYVHSAFVMHICIGDGTSLFSGLVNRSPIPVPESAEVLNILLHAIYSMPCLQFLPSFSVLERVVELLAVASYDMLKMCMVPSSPLGIALLNYAPSHAIELYTLAASHDIRELATSASSFLLSFDLYQLTDAVSQHMGSLYLKKLFFLHLGRREALRRSLAILPTPHIASSDHDQRFLQRAWMQAIADLSAEKTIGHCTVDLSQCRFSDFHTVDLSPSVLALTFKIAGTRLECASCKIGWDLRVRSMVAEWTAVKVR